MSLLQQIFCAVFCIGGLYPVLSRDPRDRAATRHRALLSSVQEYDLPRTNSAYGRQDGRAAPSQASQV